MKRTTTALLAGALFFFGAVVFAQNDIEALEAEAAAAIADDIDREAEQCISVSRIKETHIVDDNNVLFYMRGNEVYLNELRRVCRGLKRERQFSYSVRANRLCGTDAITVLQGFGSSLSPANSCGLGQFVPISEVEADFMRYGERSEIMDEPEAVELPRDDDADESSERHEVDDEVDSGYGIDQYNSEADYNFEC
jgi:hypothetical protein